MITLLRKYYDYGGGLEGGVNQIPEVVQLEIMDMANKAHPYNAGYMQPNLYVGYIEGCQAMYFKLSGEIKQLKDESPGLLKRKIHLSRAIGLLEGIASGMEFPEFNKQGCISGINEAKDLIVKYTENF